MYTLQLLLTETSKKTDAKFIPEITSAHFTCAQSIRNFSGK